MIALLRKKVRRTGTESDARKESEKNFWPGCYDMTGTTRDFRLIEEVGISNAAIVAVLVARNN